MPTEIKQATVGNKARMKRWKSSQSCYVGRTHPSYLIFGFIFSLPNLLNSPPLPPPMTFNVHRKARRGEKKLSL